MGKSNDEAAEAVANDADELVERMRAAVEGEPALTVWVAARAMVAAYENFVFRDYALDGLGIAFSDEGESAEKPDVDR